jgi:hypothetical protein
MKKSLFSKITPAAIIFSILMLVISGCSIQEQTPDLQKNVIVLDKSVGKSIWNSTTDFATDTIWTYGYYKSGFANFIEYSTQSAKDFYGDLNLVTPLIYKSGVSYPWMSIGQISIHPSLSNLGVIRWKAPHAGTYKGIVKFYEGNGSPNGHGNMGAYVLVRPISDWFISLICNNQGTNGGLTVNIPEITLFKAGDVIDVAVGPGPYGHYYGDTPVDITITETSITQ